MIIISLGTWKGNVSAQKYLKTKSEEFVQIFDCILYLIIIFTQTSVFETLLFS